MEANLLTASEAIDIAKGEVTYTEFSKISHISAGHLSMLRSGKSKLTSEVASKIVASSNGKLTMNMLIIDGLSISERNRENAKIKRLEKIAKEVKETVNTLKAEDSKKELSLGRVLDILSVQNYTEDQVKNIIDFFASSENMSSHFHPLAGGTILVDVPGVIWLAAKLQVNNPMLVGTVINQMYESSKEEAEELALCKQQIEGLQAELTVEKKKTESYVEQIKQLRNNTVDIRAYNKARKALLDIQEMVGFALDNSKANDDQLESSEEKSEAEPAPAIKVRMALPHYPNKGPFVNLRENQTEDERAWYDALRKNIRTFASVNTVASGTIANLVYEEMKKNGYPVALAEHNLRTSKGWENNAIDNNPMLIISMIPDARQAFENALETVRRTYTKLRISS